MEKRVEIIKVSDYLKKMYNVKVGSTGEVVGRYSGLPIVRLDEKEPSGERREVLINDEWLKVL